MGKFRIFAKLFALLFASALATVAAPSHSATFMNSRTELAMGFNYGAIRHIDGNYYVAGNSAADRSGALIKLDANGNEIFAKKYSSASFTDLIQLEKNKIIVSGTDGWLGVIDAATGEIEKQTQLTTGGLKAIKLFGGNIFAITEGVEIIKLDASTLSIVEAVGYSGKDSVFEYKASAIDDRGNIYIAGSSWGKGHLLSIKSADLSVNYYKNILSKAPDMIEIFGITWTPSKILMTGSISHGTKRFSGWIMGIDQSDTAKKLFENEIIGLGDTWCKDIAPYSHAAEAQTYLWSCATNGYLPAGSTESPAILKIIEPLDTPNLSIAWQTTFSVPLGAGSPETSLALPPGEDGAAVTGNKEPLYILKLADNGEVQAKNGHGETLYPNPYAVATSFKLAKPPAAASIVDGETLTKNPISPTQSAGTSTHSEMTGSIIRHCN